VEPNFKINDQVVNPSRPEWGFGTILSVESERGGASFRVRVNFSGAGVKTIVVPPGRLSKPGNVPADINPDVVKLQTLPEIITDQSIDLEIRIAELIKVYRFTDDPRGIFDWAVWRLGRNDPLKDFTADELAQFFEQFTHRRDLALKSLYREARQMGLEQKIKIILARNKLDNRV